MSADRYQRHTLIDWFNQERLRRARLVVVGAGAIGNEVLKNLSLLGVGSLVIIDFDTIESHNLTRSVLFTEADVGRPKAEVAADACRRLEPGLQVEARLAHFWNCLNLKEIQSADAVLCCVDNFEARLQLNRLSRLAGTDFYTAGIDSRYVSVETFPFSEPGRACFECALPPSVYQAVRQRYSCGWLKKVAAEERKIPTTAVTSALAGAVMTSLLLHRLSGHPQASGEALRFFGDTVSLSTTCSGIAPNPGCSTCGANGRKIALTSARRHIPLTGPAFPTPAEDIVVVLSEPVALTGCCRLCGRREDFHESTQNLTEAITWCALCHSASMEVEIRDQFTLPEFAETFSGRPIPVKYLQLADDETCFIIELED